ncbi:MAG: hypothetical protein AAF546_15365 [Verrucomicrobiota bacterium]
MNNKAKSIITKLAAIPLFLIFPLGVAAIAAVTEPTTSSADPMVAIRWFLGLVGGFLVAVILYVTVWRNANRRDFIAALKIIIAVAIFDITSFPLSRVIGHKLSPDAFPSLYDKPNQTGDDNSE